LSLLLLFVVDRRFKNHVYPGCKLAQEFRPRILTPSQVMMLSPL